MELIFKDSSGNSEVLASGNDILLLKENASSYYSGEDLIIWESGPVGKSYSEHASETQCIFKAEDGSSYSIR